MGEILATLCMDTRRVAVRSIAWLGVSWLSRATWGVGTNTPCDVLEAWREIRLSLKCELSETRTRPLQADSKTNRTEWPVSDHRDSKQRQCGN